jgi:hypothetical protein
MAASQVIHEDEAVIAEQTRAEGEKMKWSDTNIEDGWEHNDDEFDNGDLFDEAPPADKVRNDEGFPKKRTGEPEQNRRQISGPPNNQMDNGGKGVNAMETEAIEVSNSWEDGSFGTTDKSTDLQKKQFEIEQNLRKSAKGKTVSKKSKRFKSNLADAMSNVGRSVRSKKNAIREARLQEILEAKAATKAAEQTSKVTSDNRGESAANHSSLFTDEKEQATDEDAVSDNEMADSAFAKGIGTSPPRKKATKSVTIVEPSQDTEETAPRVGIRFLRIGTQDRSSFQGEEIKGLIGLIAEVDPSAKLLAHNITKTGGGLITKFKAMNSDNYANFFDIRGETWGHAREEKRRTCMSFYLETSVVSKSLRELFSYDPLKNALKTRNIRMTTHCLHESLDAEVGFFMGKSPKYTWRDDLATRIQDHLKISIEGNPMIPVSVRNHVVKDGDDEIDVVSLFVGSRDYSTVTSTLKRNLFQGCEIVLKSLKRGNPDK